MRSQDLLLRQVSPAMLWALSIVALIFAGQWLQSGVHLNHDVSYFVHFARWLLQGRALGDDLLDMNLPMAWVLFAPSAALVELKLLDEPSAVRLVFWVYFLLSTALLFRVLANIERRDHAAAIGWKTGFILIATLAPGFSFGQREHACVILTMPYVAAAVVRLQGTQSLTRPIAVCVGVLAGIGFALKPYFLAVPVILEMLLLVRLGWRSLLARGESLALGITVLVYVVTIGALIPDYLASTIQLGRSFYWAFDATDSSIVVERYSDVMQPALYGAVLAILTRSWTRQHTVILLTGAGYTASYFVQFKGYVYHAYPLLACTVIFFGICLATSLARTWTQWHETRRPLLFAAFAAALLLAIPPIKHVHDGVTRWYFQYNIAWGPAGRFRQAIIDSVNRFAPNRGTYFFALSTHPFPGFPTASYTAAEWSGRSICQSIIPAYARRDEVSDQTLMNELIRAADFQRRTVIEDFERRPPSIVFVERSRARLGMNGRQFDDLSFYSEDPRFQRIWRDYEEHPPMGPLRVFIRRVDDPQDG